MPKNREFGEHSRARITGEVSARSACIVQAIAMAGGLGAIIYLLPKITNFLETNINHLIKTLSP